MAQELPRRRWREDIVLCGRRRVEYHLNMVGAELLNWAYRKDFMDTQTRVILVPRCMCLAGKKCRAKPTDYGFTCVDCILGCRVSYLNQRSQDQSLAVYIIPHESEAFSRWKQPSSMGEGVVGIACVSTLIAGGLKAKSLGLPAQCVLLDNCGCRHWRDDEMVTDFDLARLDQIFNTTNNNSA